MKATFFAGVLRRLSIAAVLCTALAPVPSIATPQNLYVSDAFRILEITPTGTQTTFAEIGLNNPRGLALTTRAPFSLLPLLVPALPRERY